MNTPEIYISKYNQLYNIKDTFALYPINNKFNVVIENINNRDVILNVSYNGEDKTYDIKRYCKIETILECGSVLTFTEIYYEDFDVKYHDNIDFEIGLVDLNKKVRHIDTIQFYD